MVAAEIVLARTEEAAVAITGLRAYPNGFDLWLLATLRSKRRPMGTTMLLGDFEESQGLRPEFLRFGIQFADGTRCTNLSMGPPRGADTEPHGPTLQMMMTGGGRRSADWRLWVWPLPPPGPLTFVCQWPAFDLPETRAETAIRLCGIDPPAQSDVWPHWAHTTSADPEQ